MLAGNPDKKIWAAIFLRWFKENPREAWRFTLNQSELNPAMDLRLQALEQWAALDPVSARAAVQTPGDPQFKALVRGAMRGDVEAAFRLMDEALKSEEPLDTAILQGQDNFGVEEEHFAALARKNPAAAIAWAERVTGSPFLGPVLVGWLETGPAAAREWLERRPDSARILDGAFNFMMWTGKSYSSQVMDACIAMTPEGNDRIESVNEVLERLAYFDPEKALKEVVRIFKDPANQAESIGKIASIVAEHDPAKAWELLDGLGSSSTGIRRVQLPAIETGDGTSDTDGLGLFQYAWSLTSMRGLISPAELRSDLLEKLIEVDKEQAILLMNRIPSAGFMDSAGNCIERWGSRDPEEACGWLALKLGSQGDVDDLRSRSLLNELDQETLHKLAADLPPGTVRTAVLTQLASELAKEDPLAALEFAKEQGAGVESVSAIYEKWATVNPQHALKHLVANPDGPPAAWEAVVGRSLKEFPEDTARAVDSIPAGAVRDAAISSLVDEEVKGDDPLPSAGWAVTLRDEKKRRHAMEALIDRVGMDLHFAGDAKTAAALRELVSKADGMAADEKSRWLDRIESMSPQP